LITALAEYSESRRASPIDLGFTQPSISNPEKMVRYKSDDFSATLFLRVFAAAEYYTTNKTLMENVPAVYVDIILDPYIFNLFPRSLVPTAAYLTLLAIGSWYLAKYINRWVQNLAIHDVSKKNT
jgi:hypothetical protein